MKIYHFIYDDIHNPWCGGGGAYKAVEINKRLQKEHDILLFTGNYPHSTKKTIDGIPVRRLGFSFLGYAISRVSYMIHGWLQLLFVRPDIIINDVSIYAPLFSFWLTRIKQVYIINHLVEKRNYQKFSIAGFIFVIIERIFLQYCKHIIAISPSVAKKIENANPRNHVQMIPCGIDERLLQNEFYEGEYILYFGRFDFFMKGIDILIDAYTHIRALYPTARLVIAGHASEADQRQMEQTLLKRNLSQAVTIAPNVDFQRKMQLFHDAYFVILPSRFEGWGISAVEAAACGKLCIASDIDGLKDAVHAGVSGYLFPAEDTEALQRQIQYLLDNKQVYKQHFTLCKEWAKLFRWDRIAQQHIDYYKKICATEHRL